MLFDSFHALLRTLTIGISTYLAVVVILRATGKRTLSKWNAFDFIVTVALGSTLATAILSSTVTLAQGALALFLLTFLQLIVTWLSVRSERFQKLVKSTPALLLHEGKFQRQTMRRERVTEAEIRAALRGQGVAAVENVAAVILETDGTFSVIQEWKGASRTALADLPGYSSRDEGLASSDTHPS